MYVLPFAISDDDNEPIRPPPADVVASLNTHDMLPFAAFWRGEDLRLQRELGGLDASGEAAGRRGRARMRERIHRFLAARFGIGNDAAGVLRALIRYLGESAAELVMVNLEDLWLERAPQNVPGTGAERPNWRRKFDRTFDDFSRGAGPCVILKTLDEARSGRSSL